jgi:LacI family transcriptional regulator
MAKRQQRVTLEDVAREAGVSPMTISRVINNKGRFSEATRRHVLEVAERLGYRPNRAARTLVTNKTMMVGFVVPDITNPYFAEIFQGIEDVFWESGYNVLVANTNESTTRERTILAQLDDGTVDGIIACASRLPDEHLLPLLEKFPAVVTITRPVPTHLASAVVSHYTIGERMLMGAKYLSDTGRRNIGCVRLSHSSIYLSDDEFMNEMAAQGTPIPTEWSVSCPPTWKAGYNLGRQLLQTYPELDGIAGGNDLVTLGVMRAALELGRRVPNDLGLIGADDILLASQVTPPLTTFRIDKYEIGSMAARLLLLRMEGDLTYREHLYQTELIVRGST